MHTVHEMSHMMAIILFREKELIFICGIFYSFFNGVFSGGFIQSNDLSGILKHLTDLTVLKFTTKSLLISIYGFDRCQGNQVSKTLYSQKLTDDQFWTQTNNLLIYLFVIRLSCFILLLLVKNPKYYQTFVNYIDQRIYRRFHKTNEMELQTVSRFVSRRECNDNQIEVHLSDDSNSESINERNDEKQICGQRTLSIAWIDITLKVNKTFYSTEKLILREIKGFVEFGTLSALMGPSGAGKTSLLKCLNGSNKSLMTEASKIYLSKTKKIRTCFIAQDQREHIINGLTVKQALIYSSKLKNIGLAVDHNLKVNELMEELNIKDIKNDYISKCSSGQQKRIVMAMELTAQVKPNLICLDEPTSGVDSNSALIVIHLEFSIIYLKPFLLSDDKMFQTIGTKAQPIHHNIHTSAKPRNTYDLRLSLCFGQRRGLYILRTTTESEETFE